MREEELENEAEVCMHNALFWLKLPISKENVEQGGSYILKLLEPREKRIKELEVQNKALQCCANCNNSYGGEEEPYHDCGCCHAMQCICKLKLEEHTSDIYRMWEDKCDKWEMRVN